MSSLLPIAEVYDWLRKTIPALMPIPPPPFEDDRYNDRIDEKDLKRVTRLAKALGMKYVELDRYLQVFCVLDNLRLGDVSIRQVAVQWKFKHTPFVDMVFAQCTSEYKHISKEDEVKKNKKKNKKKKKKRRDSDASTITSNDSDLKSILSNETDRHEESDKSENIKSAPLRTINATQLFLNLFEFCTLSSSELMMFILHCMNIHQPSHLPTPQMFINRLIRLVHGPKPSYELTQLMRCLRCMFEPMFYSSSPIPTTTTPSSNKPPPTSSSSSTMPPMSVMNDLNSFSSSSSASTTNSNVNNNDHNNIDTNVDDVNQSMLNHKKRRLLLHDDETSTTAERWASICLILLKFPLLVQPAISLQKALQRKTLGEIFWLRMSKLRRLFPLQHHRIGFPVMTAQRILAAVEELQDELDDKHDASWGVLADTPLVGDAKDVMWITRLKLNTQEKKDALKEQLIANNELKQEEKDKAKKKKLKKINSPKNNSRPGTSSRPNSTSSSRPTSSSWGSKKKKKDPSEDIDNLWQLGMGYESWCGVSDPTMTPRRLASRAPRYRADSDDSLFSDDSDSTSEEEEEDEEEDVEKKQKNINNPNKDREINHDDMNVSNHDKDNVKNSETKIDSEGDNNDDVMNNVPYNFTPLIDDDDIVIEEDPNPSMLALWPPLGLVAEALTGHPTISPNHAWFVSCTMLVLLLKEEYMPTEQFEVANQLYQANDASSTSSSSTSTSASSSATSTSRKSIWGRKKKKIPDLTEEEILVIERKKLLYWYLGIKEDSDQLHASFGVFGDPNLPQQSFKKQISKKRATTQGVKFQNDENNNNNEEGHDDSTPVVVIHKSNQDDDDENDEQRGDSKEGLLASNSNRPSSSRSRKNKKDKKNDDDDDEDDDVNNNEIDDQSNESVLNHKEYYVNNNEMLKCETLSDWFKSTLRQRPDATDEFTDSDDDEEDNNNNEIDDKGGKSNEKKKKKKDDDDDKENEENKDESEYYNDEGVHVNDMDEHQLTEFYRLKKELAALKKSQEYSNERKKLLQKKLKNKEFLNPMICGEWKTSSFALTSKTYGGNIPGSKTPEFDVTDVRYREQLETFSGTLPGSCAPQPWACLFMVCFEVNSQKRSRASYMLGNKAVFMDESNVKQIEDIIRRMTRSNNFAQFVLAACALRFDLRLADNCSRVFKQKIEPLDKNFWITLKAESGDHVGSPFYYNFRTGESSWKAPNYIRKRSKNKEPPYIRVW